MIEQDKVQLFEKQPIRSAWNPEDEEWYFSIVDVVRILTDQPTQRGATLYWSKLKERLKKEGANQLLTNCQQLGLISRDGKRRKTDVATTAQLLRIVQSIPSKKAEPLKAWLAQVGRERIEESIDPEITINRALETYLKKGYSREWTHQRLLSIRIRNELTEEWKERGLKNGKDFAILTDEISKAWSGMSTRAYKDYKGLKKENLRDNMSDTELVLSMLAEASTRDISHEERPKGLKENKKVARQGGEVAGVARRELERRTGKSVITPRNAIELGVLMTKILTNPEDEEI
jgi:hypothetical protein